MNNNKPVALPWAARIKGFVTKNLLVITGTVTGALAGYLYWKFVGCDSGGCSITSRPFHSTVYGALMGGLIFSIFKRSQ